MGMRRAKEDLPGRQAQLGRQLAAEGGRPLPVEADQVGVEPQQLLAALLQEQAAHVQVVMQPDRRLDARRIARQLDADRRRDADLACTAVHIVFSSLPAGVLTADSPAL